MVASGLGDPIPAPAGNRVQANRIVRNHPDVFWDGAGAGDSCHGNLCPRSTPAGLCRRN